MSRAIGFGQSRTSIELVLDQLCGGLAAPEQLALLVVAYQRRAALGGDHSCHLAFIQNQANSSRSPSWRTS